VGGSLRHFMATQLASPGALGNPETSYDSRYRPDRRVVLGRTTGGRRLKIVITKDDPAMVITVADRDIEE
jgi:hypothetical protein